MAEDWTHEEVEATIADYFGMLDCELRGQPFNKKEHNRILQLLVRRSPGAIERKHQNISAVLLEIGYPNIEGYKPLGNYQALLKQVVLERLAMEPTLRTSVDAAVNSPADSSLSLSDVLSILVDPPIATSKYLPLYDQPMIRPILANRNYLEIESRNQSLGSAGEELVIRFEHERLCRAGKQNLAERIEHVAKTKGDAAGYDVLSFETNGRERPIEVKTTRYGAWTPFFASRNEVEFSHCKQEEYHLYRLFRFGQSPKLFVLPGALQSSCALDPILFSAIPMGS